MSVWAPVAVDVRNGVGPLPPIGPAVHTIEHFNWHAVAQVPQGHFAGVARRHRKAGLKRMADDHVHGLGVHAREPRHDTCPGKRINDHFEGVGARQQQRIIGVPRYLVHPRRLLPPAPPDVLLFSLRCHERRFNLPCFMRTPLAIPPLQLPNAYHSVPGSAGQLVTAVTHVHQIHVRRMPPLDQFHRSEAEITRHICRLLAFPHAHLPVRDAGHDQRAVDRVYRRADAMIRLGVRHRLRLRLLPARTGSDDLRIITTVAGGAAGHFVRDVPQTSARRRPERNLLLRGPVPLEHLVPPIPHVPHPTRTIKCRRKKLMRTRWREHQRRYQTPVRLERPDQPPEPVLVHPAPGRRASCHATRVTTPISLDIPQTNHAIYRRRRQHFIIARYAQIGNLVQMPPARLEQQPGPRRPNLHQAVVRPGEDQIARPVVHRAVRRHRVTPNREKVIPGTRTLHGRQVQTPPARRRGQ